MVALGLVLAFTVMVTPNKSVHANSDSTTGICDRTEEVRTAILRKLPDVSDCGDVTDSHLAGITGELSVSYNSISALKTGDFRGLSGLEQLAINRLGLEELPEDIFDGLSSLWRLSLSWNDLEELPADVFDGLSNLTHLYIEGNEITTLPADVFDGLSSLETLHLRDNELNALPADVFDGLGSLETLRLNDNELTTLPADVFEELDSLKSLSLTDNELTTLPVDPFDDIDDSLEALYLGYNHLALSELPSDFFESFTSLVGLDLAGIGKDYEGDNEGSLTSLNYDWWNDLASLRGLGLGYNELATLPSDTFEGFSSLTFLDLSGNDLTSLPADVFDDQTNLKHLRMPQNQLATLPANLLNGLTQLEKLHLHENKFTTLPAGLLGGLTQLEQLYLHGNQLSSLPDGLFEGPSELQSLKLGRNPGTPFTLSAELERDNNNDGVMVKVAEGAPFDIKVTLSADGGSLSHDTITIDAGNLKSNVIAITPDTGRTQVTVSVESASFVDWDSAIYPGTCSPNGRAHSGAEGIEASPGSSLTLTASGTASVLVNNPAKCRPLISYLALRVGFGLSPSLSSITDIDGLDNVVYSYQWLADGADIAGATSSTYTIQSSDVGKAIQLRVTFTDDLGNKESLTSVALPAVLGLEISGVSATDYAENGTSTVAVYAATGANGTVTWSLTGVDSDDFSISSSGALTFSSAPDHEDASDFDTNNVYEVTVNASDGTNNSAPDTVTVAVRPPLNPTEAPCVRPVDVIDYALNIVWINVTNITSSVFSIRGAHTTAEHDFHFCWPDGTQETLATGQRSTDTTTKTGLTSGTRYWWAAKAARAARSGNPDAWSEWVEAITTGGASVLAARFTSSPASGFTYKQLC